MKYEYYRMLIGEYINLGRSEEKLLGEIGYPEEIDLKVDDFVTAIKIIGAAADRDVKRLVALSGLKSIDFARKYILPYRTLQDWCAGKHTPPEYLPVLIGYVMVTGLGDGNGDI